MITPLLAAGVAGSPYVMFAVGLAAALGVYPLVRGLFRMVTVEVDDEETVLVTRFGKLAAKLDEPGLHLVFDRFLPHVKLTRVSRRLDFRHLSGLHVNDSEGTTVIVDLWIELRVQDPVKAMYGVADWDTSLQNLVAHAATSVLGNRSFRQILCDRTELGVVDLQDRLLGRTQDVVTEQGGHLTPRPFGVPEAEFIRFWGHEVIPDGVPVLLADMGRLSNGSHSGVFPCHSLF